MKGDRKLVYTKPLFDSKVRYLHSLLQVDHMLVLYCPLDNGNI